jgi:hypothetical protein
MPSIGREADDFAAEVLTDMSASASGGRVGGSSDVEGGESGPATGGRQRRQKPPGPARPSRFKPSAE